MKTGKSMSTKIILMVEAILLFSSAIFCGVSISRAQAGIRRAIRQRMVDISSCAAGSVNGDMLERLQAGDENTPEYRTVYDTMAVFRDNVELEYIYAIRDEGNGQFTFIVDTDPEEPGAFGDEVQYTEALNTASKGTTAVDEVPYSDQWGQFYSAYSPVYDSAGKIAGIVAADFSVEWFDAQLREQTLSNITGYIIVLILTLLGAAGLCLVTLRPYVRQQEQLLEEKVVAESANRAKSEFLANMSHEIRTPINAVLGMNELIRRESRQGRALAAGDTEGTHKAFDQIDAYAGEVDSAGRSLLTIVNDILDFSRIEAGKMELVKGPYRLRKLLNDVCGMNALKAKEKGLAFTQDTDESVPDCLFGDEIRVREILINILNNAVKYTERGYVRLKVFAGESAGDTVRLVFRVEDSGIGIRRGDMDRLFDKFERLDMQRNSTVEGSGLGLVITRSLLDMMDGTIEVESEYGKGSVFTVTIPQRVVSDDADGEPENRPETETAAETDRQAIFRAPEARVLIVDDTKMNLTVMAGLLKHTEMQIDTALSGAEAIVLAEKTAYDVIFMDQRMPGMDGTETLHRIRGLDGENRGTPVICLTADAIVGAKERYLAEGFSDYLSKPVNSRMLEDMLWKYLPKKKMISADGENTEKPAAPEEGDGYAVLQKAGTAPKKPAAPGKEDDYAALQEAGIALKKPVAPGEADDYAALRQAGISPENGLNYCQGDRELYDTLLSEYLGEYPERSGLLGTYFAARDWKNYVIYAHSLKSSSKMLGADDLSRMAARMEAAANSGDEEAILKEHGKMMDRYDEVARAVRQVAAAPEAGDEPEMFEFAPE